MSLQKIYDTGPSDVISRLLARTAPAAAAPAPAPAPAAPTAPAAPAASAPGFAATSDPVLQQIRDAGKAATDAARTSALVQAEQALIGYGGIGADAQQTLRAIYGNDSSNPIIGALQDTQTQTAAAANPHSTLAELARAHQGNVQGATEGYNKRNLFYSGHYAKALGDENYAYGGAQSKAVSGLAGSLAGIYGNVLNTEQAANNNYTSALGPAYDRYLTANPYGTGTSTAPPPAATPTVTPPATPKPRVGSGTRNLVV